MSPHAARAVAVFLAVAIAGPSIPLLARAEPPRDARAEAADRFDRGLRLFNDGNNDGALAEFKRADEVIPGNAVVLYNIGLVYAAMNRPVEAVESLGRVLTSPGPLKPTQLANASRVHGEQLARIAELTVTVSVDGAILEIDSVHVAKAPLAGPLRIASGTHIVSAIAAGHLPMRKEVSIAGGGKASLEFALVAMEGRLAHLAVKTRLPGAEVFVDGQHAARTPLRASLTLSPAQHTIELRRPGYVTAQQTLTLGDGASGEVTLEPEEDRASLASEGGMLALDLSESQAVVTIDGRPRGVYASPLRLARGPHHLLVERGEFEPFERDVEIESRGTTRLAVALEPTPEHRAKYSSAARSQRTWGWISVLGGVAAAGAGVGLFVYDAGKRTDGNNAIDNLVAAGVRGSGGRCDFGALVNEFDKCRLEEAAARAQVADANTRDVFAYIGMGVGAAAIALGVVLLVTSDDASRYDRKPATQPASVRVAPTFWTSRGGGGFGLAGRF